MSSDESDHPKQGASGPRSDHAAGEVGGVAASMNGRERTGHKKTKPSSLFVYPRHDSANNYVAEADEATIPVVDAAFAPPPDSGGNNIDPRAERLRAAEQRAADAEAGRLAAERRLADETRSLRERLASLTKRQCLGLGLATFGLLVVAVSVAFAVCGSDMCRNNRNTTTTTTTSGPPTTSSPPLMLSARAQFIVDYINNITLTGRTLTYPDRATPEGRALAWLIDYDVGTSELDLVSLRQRYALTTLLFQMPNIVGSGDGDGANNKTWGTAMNVCQWRNVTCDDTDRPVRNVEALQLESTLEGIRVEGQIPPDLGLLTSLRQLEFSATRLGGTIPSSLGLLTSLLDLTLANNALTGTIPSSIGSLTSLIFLWLSSNALNGTIPSSLGSLTSLDTFLINDNALSGTIPSSMARMKSLTVLNLQNNNLTGTIPSSVGDLASLEALLLDRNSLNGTIPSSLAYLTSLNYDLTLGANQLTGTIPSSLRALTSLLRLALWDNALTGTIPEALASMKSLQALVVNNNNLTGPIPLSLASLTSLTALWLQNNDLTGAFPLSLVSLTSLNDLTLYNNNITGSIPFCNFLYLEADCNEVDCPCCKHCCPTGGWNGIPEIPKARTTRCDS
jgi:hypothetical protein